MIKKLFLPDKIGKHRIYAQRVLGICIHQDSISLAQVHAKRSKNVIEKLFEVPIEKHSPENYNQAAATALKNIFGISTDSIFFEYNNRSTISSLLVILSILLYISILFYF